MVRLLAALTAERFDEGSERFQRSNLEVVSIDVGNRAFNVIPAAITAKFNIRFSDRWTYDTLTARIRAILDGVLPGGYGLVLERFNSPAFFTDAGALIEPLAAAIEDETGLRPERSTSGGTSDARFIKAYCPVVEFGLVSRTIHQIDEQVPVADLHALKRIYRGFIDRFFASA
jgi:succinyl-diaminopimelate desuccinylase